MGHQPGDYSYWKYYRSECSTIDYQAIAHGAEIQDVSMLSSISLNRTVDAPQRLSIEGHQRVTPSPEFLALQEVETALLDRLLVAHKSLKEAAKVTSTVFADYERTRINVKSLRKKLREAEYRQEYKNFFLTPYPTSKPSQTSDDFIDPAGAQGLANPAAEPPSADYPLHTSTPTQPPLDANDQFRPDDMEAIFSSADDVNKNGSGVILDSHRRMQLGMDKVVKMNTTMVDDIPSALFKGELNDTELSNVMVAAFNRLHQIDFFLPGQEPYPCTYECRFCGLLLSSKDCPSEHVKPALSTSPPALVLLVTLIKMEYYESLS